MTLVLDTSMGCHLTGCQDITTLITGKVKPLLVNMTFPERVTANIARLHVLMRSQEMFWQQSWLDEVGVWYDNAIVVSLC